MRPWRPVLLLAAALAILPGCHREENDPDFFDPSDFDADGFADVAVGAPLDDAAGAGTDRGRVYLYRGPTLGTPIPVDGTEDASRFGFSVASAGDFNGDGLPDLAVGAPQDDADDVSTDSGDNRGRVYVFFGGVNFPVSVIRLNGSEAGGQFGFSVARAGDVNGDGFDDLVVGAPFESAGGTQRGRAYVYFGGPSPSLTPGLTFSGSEDLGRFGFSVSTAGDINPDGFFDWMIGAPGDDNDGDTTTDSGLDRGRVFLYRGAAFPDNGVDTVINGAEDNGELGTSLAGILDVNSDGSDDVIIGAPFDDGDGNTGTSAAPILGRAYLFFGTSLNSVASVSSFGANRIFTGTEDGGRFGEYVARLGDVNSGGAPDFFIGAPFDDADGTATDEATDRGRGFVYFGGPTIDTIADLTLSGVEDGARFGAWAGSGGDINGDGGRDFTVGAPLDDGDDTSTQDGLDRGRAFFFRGGASLNPGPDVTLEGAPEDGAQAGTSGA